MLNDENSFGIRNQEQHNMLVPLLESMSTLIKNDSEKVDLKSEEFELLKYGAIEHKKNHMQNTQIECIVMDLAHLDQFPQPASVFASSLPCLFAWKNVNEVFPSEFYQMIGHYFKMAYSSFKNFSGFNVMMGPSFKNLESLLNVRNKFASSRILFHYIGYGFPEIQKDFLWCSDKRSKDFTKFSLKNLFKLISTPSWYIFDCSNAGVVINSFLNYTNEIGLEDNDWFCICATKEGEKLPNDPRLPKDFLTSTILSPIKTAVVCHILRNFRNSLVDDKFPIDSPYSVLWNSKTKEGNRLNLALEAITDAIAGHSLPEDEYNKIFRSERFSSIIFRHFLLAQFLLSPYRVHPVSYPKLPDLSQHLLWRKWSILLDSAICSLASPSPSVSTNLFQHNETSFQVFLRNNQFDLIQTYNFIFLYHMIFSDLNNENPILLLAEYAANENCCPSKMLINSAVFNLLLLKLLSKNCKSDIFQPLCYLILKFLYIHPVFAKICNQNNKSIATFLPNMFCNEIDEELQIMCSAIIANLVIHNEIILQYCSSHQFIKKCFDILQNCSSKRALWILLIFKRAFNDFSPDQEKYLNNGLHLLIAKYLFDYNPLIRAASIGALSSFIFPSKTTFNIQLFLLVLPKIIDGSYLVRYHLLLFIGKFICLFYNVTQIIPDEQYKNKYQSSLNLLNVIYKKDNLFFNNISDLCKVIDSIFSNLSYTKLFSYIFLILKILLNDPHPDVSNIAKKELSFLESLNMFNLEKIETREFFHSMVIHRIALHQLLEERNWQSSSYFSKMDYSPPCLSEKKQYIQKKKSNSKNNDYQEYSKSITIENMPLKSLSSISFLNESILLSNDNFVYFINEKQKIFSIESSTSIVSLIGVNQETIIFATNDGVVHIWNPSEKHEKAIWKPTNLIITSISLEYIGNNILYIVINNSILSKWNIKTEEQIDEYNIYISKNTNIIKLGHISETLYLLSDDGKLFFYNMEKINNINIEFQIQHFIIDDNIIYFSNKNKLFSFQNGVTKELFNSSNEIKSFCYQRKTGLIFILSTNNTLLVITSAGKIFNEYTCNSDITMFTVHSELPISAISDSKGNISIISFYKF